MSNPHEPQKVSPETLRQLGLDSNDLGGLGKLRGPATTPFMSRAENATSKQLEQIPVVHRDLLIKLAQGMPFPLRDVLSLYAALNGSLDHTTAILTKAVAQNLPIQALLDAVQPAPMSENEVGQPMDTEVIDVQVKASGRQYLHVEMNKPVQYLVLSPEGAASLISSMLDGLIELVAPDVDRTDAPPMELFIFNLLESARADQRRFEQDGE